MSSKVDSPTAVESLHGQSNVASSTVTANSPKVSMFGAKAGFVIPKNKLSGSLVPIFRSGSKVDAGSIVKEDSTKQVQRKTKWGADLTQDATVRKGRALAYQTRVEQITQQLKSGTLEFEDDNGSESPKQSSSADSAPHVDRKSRKAELLELERRELIGEILRLNPSYKAPPDYKPLLKESKVPIPVKTHPGYNFVCLLLGPESNTQKRLEEETGAKVRVYGTKSGSGERSEITKSEISEAQDIYDDLYVHVSAETYEKVDIAVALIELLLTPVSEKAGVTPNVASSLTRNIEDVQTESHDSSSLLTPPATNVIQTTPQISPPFQPYPAPWFPATPNVQPPPSSAFRSPLLSTNSIQFPLSQSSPSIPGYFAQPPLSIPLTSPAVLRSQLPIRLPPNQYPLGPISQPLASDPVATLRMPGPVSSQIGLPTRPLITPATSGGWHLGTNAPPGPNLYQIAPLSSSNITMRPLSNHLASTNSGPSPNLSPHLASSLFPARPSMSPPNFSSAPSQTRNIPNPGMPPPSPAQGSLISLSPHPSFPRRAPPILVMSPPTPLILQPPMPVPAPSPIPLQPQLRPPSQVLPSISTSNSTIIPTFPSSANSPISTTSPVAALKPMARPTSGDFTFQPLRTQPPPPANSPASHNSQVPFEAPKAPSFRPALQNLMPGPLSQSSSSHHQPLPIFQGFPSQSPVQQVSPATPVGSPSFPLSSQTLQLTRGIRPRGSFTVPGQPLGAKPMDFTAVKEGAFSGSNQIYDPFSPTASATPPDNVKKPDTDAEYEDLMASVGVK